MKYMNKTVFRLLLLSIVCLLIGIGLLVHVPYYMMEPGNAIDTTSVVKVAMGQEGSGNFYLTTIMLKEGSVFDYLYAKFSDQVQLIPKDQVLSNDESDQEYNERSKANMISSQNNAVISAFRMADKPIQIHHQGVKVIGLTPLSEKDFQVGDIIFSINQQSTLTLMQLKQQLKNLKVGNKVNVRLKRNGKIIEKSVALKALPNHQVGFGIVPFDLLTLKTDPKINFQIEDIGGPSAGLMFSLEILDQLLPEDLTKGYQIAGTGTISATGEVGQIGGIEQKMIAAEQKNAEIFFCPKDKLPGDQNEKKGVQKAQAIGSDMKIVPVGSLQEAVDYLRKLPKHQ